MIRRLTEFKDTSIYSVRIHYVNSVTLSKYDMQFRLYFKTIIKTLGKDIRHKPKICEEKGQTCLRHS